MSLVEREVKSKLIEKPLNGEAKLILTDNIMSQIDYLHKIVGSVEWSGVLVYKVNKGSIEDYKNLEVEVLEILPMDVGTSGYTEYELSSADDYTFNNLCDRVMMDENLKIGHIHTHHGMSCFFSGTDTQELHDNAPNHNYYLSLIVNFKDFSNWCAKIALVGEERQTGTLASKFKGTKGDMVENFVEINNTKEVLYTIKMNIDAPVTELDEFKTRVLELNKERGRKYENTRQFTNVNGKNVNISFQGFQRQGNLFDQPGHQKRQFSAAGMNVKGGKFKPLDLSEQNITAFANKVLAIDENPTGNLHTNISVLDGPLSSDHPESEIQKQLYVDSMLENFDLLFEKHFETSVDIGDENSVKLVEDVVKKVIAILKPYGNAFDFVNEVTDELSMHYVLEDDDNKLPGHPAMVGW